MNCASCGRANRPTARFCSGCGQTLAPRCGRCGSENAADAQFCDSCGAPLSGPSAPEASARKIVTIVFADLIGSVGLHERLDAENARRFTARYHEAMSAVVEAHGGTVVQLLGDGVLTAFGVPRVSEDDAIRGVRAAVAMQATFRELLREQAAAVGAVGLRVAVNTGEVVVSGDQTSVIGDPTNVAARLQQEARDGDVLIGEATQQLVEAQVTLAPLGRFAIRGRVEPVEAYRVVSLEPPAGAQGTAFVGREEELRRLRATFDSAVAAPGARLAVLLGSPGLGKTRLIAEFARRLRERATVLSARCDSARGHSFAPLAAALRAQLELGAGADAEALRAAIDRIVPGADPERTRIATGIGALLTGAPAQPEETFFVVRRLLAGLATARPVVLAIDDVQWAEPLLLDLAEHLVQWSSGVPLLVLLGARPELRETRSALATPGGAVAEVVTLGGLEAGAATRLAANAVGADELPAALVGRVLAVSEGNPLFVGELVRMLVHDGALKREGERWTTGVEVARLEMPPTIHALLAARIERLGAEERAILERAAVVGRRFSRAALAHLLQRAPEELDPRLESLRRSELIEPDGAWFLGEPALRFHHALIRDAAYRRVLRRTRAELHEQLADWIAARPEGGPEREELAGRHLEQAHAHLRGLGPLDAHGSALGKRAARHLGAAGKLALAGDDLRPASDLLGRAVSCLESDDPARADLALDWCEALLTAGDVGPAARALAELGRFAAGSERLHAWHACFAGELAVLTDPQALHSSAEAAAAAAAALAAAGDVAGEAKAHSVHATALARLGQIGASEAALDRALAAARRARDRRRANGVLAGAPLAALYGPSPVARASGRCLDVVRVLRITQGAPAVEAVALRCQAVLEALRGRTEAARRMIAAARKTVEELGNAPQLLEVEFFAGYVELLEGDREAAARFLSVAYEGFRKRGLGIDAARAAGMLARTRLAQGDAVGAEVLTQESEALAGDDLNASIVWRGVRAEALAERGEHAAAVELARAAVEIAAPTDALLHHANARRALAVALRAAGREPEAAREDARAIELWEAKGASLLAERARAEGGQREPARPAQLETPPRAVARVVRPNFATAHFARLVAAIQAGDPAALPTRWADDHFVFDHVSQRTYDREGPLSGWNMVLRSAEGRFELEVLASLGESLAVGRNRVGFRSYTEGELEVGASSFEFLLLSEVDARSVRQGERFDPARLDHALVRLYERHAELLPEGGERQRAAARARGVDAFLRHFELGSIDPHLAPDLVYVDHRQLSFPSGRGAEGLLAALRARDEMSSDRIRRIEDVLAQRDDALLVLIQNSGVDLVSGGAYERRYLQLVHFGAEGRLARTEWFDEERSDAALARFGGSPTEARFAPRANAASRAVERFERCWSERDWDGVLATYAPAHVMDDRRKLFQLQVAGEGFRANERHLFDLPSSHWESELLAIRGDRLAVLRVRFTAEAEDSGPMAVEMLDLVQVDADGRRIALVVFDPDAGTAAWAELDRRAADSSAAGSPVVNAALRASGRIGEALFARDWTEVRAFARADFRFEDRRKHSQLSGDIELYIRNLEVVSAWPGRRVERRLLAAPRDELSLERITYTGGADGDEFAGEFLRLCEVDAEGRLLAVVHFDPEDHRAALRRLEPAPTAAANAATRTHDRCFALIQARDWEALEPLTAPGFRYEDRRGHVQIEGDRALYLANLRYISELSRTRRVLLATEGQRVALYRSFFVELDADGEFEVETLSLVEVDGGDRITAITVFEGDAEGVARAELAERARLAGPDADPQRIPPNAASRASDRLDTCRNAGDWEALRELCAPIVFGDRRPLFQMTGDCEMVIASARWMRESGVRARRMLVATAGDRLALERTVFADRSSSEVEVLQLTEVDVEGRLTGLDLFGSDQRVEAHDELSVRLARGEAAQCWPPTILELMRCLRDRDLGRLAKVLPEHVVIHDHRRTGIGRIEGAGPYIASVAALFAQIERFDSETLYWVAIEPHASLGVARTAGTLAVGGGEFESIFLRLVQHDAGGIQAIELFELDDLARARKRFAVLRPTPA